jgi:hypothetical protein
VARLGLIPRRLKAACVVVCFVAVCLIAANGGAMFAQQQTGGAASEKTVLRGVVVNSVTHQPVGHAVVMSPDGRFATMTNDRGQFEMVFKVRKSAVPVSEAPGGEIGTSTSPQTTITTFTNGSGTTTTNGTIFTTPEGVVERPDYLTARRMGFVNRYTSGNEAVAVARDQEEVTILLTPEAKVIGHVTLADGEGAEGMPLELYRQTVQDGRMRWTSAGSVQARSDGEFRFADLEAGNYKLYSGELPDRDPVTSDPRGQGYGYPPDYFPGATDFAGGAVFHLTAGETFQANLTPEKRRYYPVHIGMSPDMGHGIRNMSTPNVEVERDGHPGPGFTLGPDYRDGSIGGMLPDGNYLVRISTQSSNALTGVVNISVHGGPAASMVTLLPGTDIDVRVNDELSEQTRQAQQSQPGGQSLHGPTLTGINQRERAPIQLQLSRVEEFNQEHVYMAEAFSNLEGQELVIRGVAAGEYRVSVQTPIGYVASVRSGDTDLQTSNLVVGGGSSVPSIEVTLRDDGAEVDGSIVELANHNAGNNGQPTGFVYFVPVEFKRGLKLFVAQLNGEFQAMQLPPGTYRVLAFERPKNDLEYADDDAMRKYDPQTLTLEPGQKTKIQLSLSSE